MAPQHPLADRDRWRLKERLVGDASTRTYTRLDDRQGRSWILSEYPAESRAFLGRDLEVLSWLAGRGVRVPAVVDHDLEAGWSLLEDLGRDDAAQLLRTASTEQQWQLLEASLGPLVTLARIDPAQLPHWNPSLDGARLRWELAGFELWFVRHWRGLNPEPWLAEWLDGLAQEISGHPKRICHRDYHLNNLFLLAGGEVGVIDVQDILVGPDTYDAVSLLAERDTPRLIDPALRLDWLERWAESTGATSGWRQRWPVVRLQRALKVLGTFARLSIARSPGYRQWMESLATELMADSDLLQLPGKLRPFLLD
jgi:aminoglycoside/choline kinase family phosphotransferase